MRRDMTLIRQIAFAIEDSPGPFVSEAIEIAGASPAAIAYHLELMHEAGLFLGQSMEGPVTTFYIVRLTAAGHDFVDAARNERLWKRSLATIQEQVGSVSVQMLTAYLKKQAAAALGLGEEAVS